MILFNENFSKEISKTILSEYFTTITTPKDLNCQFRSSALNGSLLYKYTHISPVGDAEASNALDAMKRNPRNFQIVTEKFLKILDKVYTKIWNESFSDSTSIYTYAPAVLVNLYSCFSDSNYGTTPVKFFQFVERCITAGVLTEEDRLTAEDQIFISQPFETISTNIDTVNSIITFSSNSVIDIQNFSTKEGSYLYGKKLYLLFTPFIANASILNSTKSEPVSSKLAKSPPGYVLSSTYSPWGFFKPKTSSSKFGSSVPMATHLFWRIGTPEDKELALLEGTEVPEIIFDHLDTVTHIDSFKLQVKYGPVQFS